LLFVVLPSFPVSSIPLGGSMFGARMMKGGWRLGAAESRSARLLSLAGHSGSAGVGGARLDYLYGKGRGYFARSSRRFHHPVLYCKVKANYYYFARLYSIIDMNSLRSNIRPPQHRYR
jgi:hypothetical protein